MQIRVLLADDHALVRAGIGAVLKEVPGVTVVAEARDGQEALELMKKLAPDVAIIDVVMPKLNGLEVALRANKQCPEVRVLMMSGNQNEEYVVQALRAGVAGYVLKDSTPEELRLALEAVARGDKYLSSSVSKQVIDDYVRRVGQHTTLLDALTSRQREVLQLLAEGHSAKEIAGMLQTSVKTIEAHRAQLMARLGVHDLASLVRYAIRAGLLPGDR